VEATPSPLSPTVLCRGWGSSGSFQPEAVALFMAFKPRGLGFKIAELINRKKTMCSNNFLNQKGYLQKLGIANNILYLKKV
jgi:hypothetical protein